MALISRADTQPDRGITESIGDLPSIPQRPKDIFEFFSHV